MRRAFLLLSSLLLAAAAFGQECPARHLDEITGRIDATRLKATVDKLASFGTRHTLSDTTSATRGIGAARKWIFDEMSRWAAESGGRMTVEYQSSMQQSKRTNDAPAEMINVVATIRGTTDPNRVYIATGHYDSMNSNMMDPAGDAPGADDDASGTAVIMELARVLSKTPADATIILAAVMGEEQGLLGAKGLADWAAEKKLDVEGDITNDIVGGISGTNGATDNTTIRIFSANEKPNSESSSRHWARFVRDGVREWLPAVHPRLVYRLDRFARSGDHKPFFDKGFPAIRFTEPNEDYHHEHQSVRMENGIQYGDLPQYVDGNYLKLVASVNAVALVTGACAPAAPRNVKNTVRAGLNDTILTWELGTDADLDHYEIVIRETTSDEWERVIPAGKAATYTLKNVTIDNYLMGVRAVDKDGNRSPVRTVDADGGARPADGSTRPADAAPPKPKP
jgi:Zn-dependent M28 family amino/carboxypeptidase